MGAVMMTGFFMLSGFSLYYAYEDKELYLLEDIEKFYKKRISGIFPAYYIIGLVYCILVGAESVIDNIFLMPMEILALQSIYPSTFGLTHNGGTWFISCIVLCYIVFPFIKECVVQMDCRNKLLIATVVIGILLYSPIVTWWFGLPSIYSNPAIRMMEFFVGIILASFLNELKKQGRIKAILFNKATILAEWIVAITCVSLLYHMDIARGNYLLYSWICLPLFALMLLGLAGTTWKKLNDSKWLSYASEISYAFFLVQLFMWPIMRKWLEFTGIQNNLFKIVSSYVFCTMGAILIHELIEKPFKMIIN